MEREQTRERERERGVKVKYELIILKKGQLLLILIIQ